MQLDVAVQLRDQRWKKLLRPYCKTVREVCELTLAHTKLVKGSYECCVVLADDAFVRQLNHDYRGQDKATNVLSFTGASSAQEGKGVCELGDIVLAYDTLEREAQEQSKKPRDHALHLLIHGILHLAGYDHEQNADAAKMENLEIKILKNLNVENPYL